MNFRILVVMLCFWLTGLESDRVAASPENASVDDQAGVLTAHEAQRIHRLTRMLLQELDIDIQVIVPELSPHDINRQAVTLFEDRGVGQTTQGSRGMLLLVDPRGKQVRLEIGYDLESIFPDGFANNLVRKQMIPFFQADQVGAGIEATVELLVSKVLESHQTSGTAGTSAPSTFSSGGGGTRASVEIGSGLPDKPVSSLADQFGPQPSPLEALHAYRDLLKLRINDPDLALYTPATREFFRHHIVTDAQQDNAFRSLEAVFSQGTVYQQEKLAVIRYPITNRQAHPYFLCSGDQGWMLDFAAMNRLIGMNHVNQWFFRTTSHEFMFAFQDVFFDKHGFPHLPGK